MNRKLAEAVVATFRSRTVSSLSADLTNFSERDWMRAKDWLDTSGLALYFLARIKSLHLEDALPAKLLGCLELNYSDNRVRTEDMFGEFARINMEFQRAQLTYANLKGFSLAPRFFTDPNCRYQHDLDFLMSKRDTEECRRALERHGYELTGVSADTLEFRAGAVEVSSLSDLYKIRSQRSLEIHFAAESDDRLARLQLQVWNGFEFPALSELDKFLGQAHHLFKHFQTEFTRTAWILEFATCIQSHEGDEAFWRDAVAAVKTDPQMKLAAGAAVLIAGRTFGVATPPDFAACTVNEVPSGVALWMDRYHDELVFMEPPGSKLYLLLQDILFENEPDWRERRRKRLVPSRPPRERISVGETESAWLRMRLRFARFRYFCIRMRFHAREGVRYKIEAARWKKLLAIRDVDRGREEASRTSAAKGWG
jgi:hypothetical protein